MTPPVIAGAAVGLIAVWAIYSYNFLIHARAKVREALSGVDVQLKLRHDLVPNLNEVVRAYATHEQGAMRAAGAQRSRAIAATRLGERQLAENALADGLTQLIATAEQNPRLKAADRFIALAAELVLIEDELQAARELYNANAEFFNTRAQNIPMVLVANWMRPNHFDYLRLDRVEFDAIVRQLEESAA